MGNILVGENQHRVQKFFVCLFVSNLYLIFSRHSRAKRKIHFHCLGEKYDQKCRVFRIVRMETIVIGSVFVVVVVYFSLIRLECWKNLLQSNNNWWKENEKQKR